MNVLIVCAGNTCRSPIASGLLLRVAGELGIQVSVRTAGLAPHPNRPVASHAVEVMREIGIDISHEYSKPVTDADLEWADIVVCLQKSHLAHLAEENRQLVGKLRYLGRDIGDPYLGALEVYRATRDEIDGLIRDVPKSLLGDEAERKDRADAKERRGSS